VYRTDTVLLGMIVMRLPDIFLNNLVGTTSRPGCSPMDEARVSFYVSCGSTWVPGR
jgi:hypothetical protein